jgi:hypothetical protein
MNTTQKTYYLAYGMNTNKTEMARRCPAAIPLGKLTLPNYQFVFRGVGDILPTNNPNKFAQCVLWEITPQCELALDRLEGFPRFYIKEYFNLIFQGEIIKVMVYKMKHESYQLHDPSYHYWQCLVNGYKTYGLPIDQLFRGLPYNSTFKNQWEVEYSDIQKIKNKRRKQNIQKAMWKNINF